MKKLGFGLMRLPMTGDGDKQEINYDELNKMIDEFMKRGFTYFDTAYMYCDFRSETAVRETLVKRYPRGSYTLADKMPTMFLKTKEDQERIFNEQLEKCGVEYFDYYLLHNLNTGIYPTVEELGTFEFALEKKKEGKIRHLGFSFHDSAQFLDKILTEHPETEFVQLQINYLDWDNEGVQSGKCYETARKHNKPIIVMEPVKGGALANVPEKAGRLMKKYSPEASAASWAIRYAAGIDGVMTVLSGMSDMAQMNDNLSYMENFKPLSIEESEIVKQCADIINESADIPCTACRYCIDWCPKKIAFADYFALYNAEKKCPGKGFSTHREYYENYTEEHGKASDCIGCKQCAEHCPQHLNIPKYLERVAKAFE